MEWDDGGGTSGGARKRWRRGEEERGGKGRVGAERKSMQRDEARRGGEEVCPSKGGWFGESGTGEMPM